jgi:hypothetical protein
MDALQDILRMHKLSVLSLQWVTAAQLRTLQAQVHVLRESSPASTSEPMRASC